MRYFVFIALLLSSFLGYSQSKIRIACMGNSITYGASVKQTVIRPNWAPCLAKIMKSVISESVVLPCCVKEIFLTVKLRN